MPNTPIRGAGRPNAAFVLERTMDTVARELGLDRAAVRRTNFVRKDQFPYETGGKLPTGVTMVLKSSGYAAFEQKRAAQRRVARPDRRSTWPS